MRDMVIYNEKEKTQSRITYGMTDTRSLRQSTVLSKCFRCKVSVFEQKMGVNMDANGGYRIG